MVPPFSMAPVLNREKLFLFKGGIFFEGDIANVAFKKDGISCTLFISLTFSMSINF